MKLPVYLDYAATTPVDPRVAEKMAECLTLEGNFGNPASRSHIYGWKAEDAAETARREVADLIGADPREIVWTSGATESDNLAIKGVAYSYQDKGRHIITSAIEHKAVLDSCGYLEQQGFEVSYLEPDADGCIRPEQVAAALRDDTILISLMHANNETGVITDIAAIAAVAREHGAVFHVDAAQSAGKIAIDVKTAQVDLMSLSAHKMYGPKGVGALYVCRQPRVKLVAQIHGGGHERGMRSGTLATHQLVGFGEAARIAREQMTEESQRLRQLKQRFWQGVQSLGECYVNGDIAALLPGHLNVRFGFIEGKAEALMLALKDLAVSSGSACTSASLDPSYVLSAMGLSDEQAHSSLRFTLGRFTTEADVDQAVASIRHAVTALRAKSASWQAHQARA